MNQTQLKYALSRVDQIFTDRQIVITKKHTTPGKSLTDAERADLVRSGKVKLRADCRAISYHADAVKVLDFSKFETNEVKDQKTIDAEIKKLQRLCRAAKDEMMLGDENKARDLLAVLEAGGDR